MKYLAIHHTAVSSTSPQLYAVNRYHKGKFGVRSSLGWYVGYNDFIDIDGRKTHCREWGEETTAVIGHNCDKPERCDTIHVCVAGDFNFDVLAGKQLDALKAHIYEVRKTYPDIQVVGHRDLQDNRTCPGLHINPEAIAAVVGADYEKAAEIARLQSILDSLRATLIALLKRL